MESKPVYFLAEISVHNPDLYNQYIQKAQPIVLKNGGRYLIRGGTTTSFSGDWNPPRLLLIEFPSLEHLHNCFNSKEYREIKILREKSAQTRAIIAEGYC